MQVEDLAGLVLAAGQSSRFGGEKALAELGGRSLLERAVARLGAFAARVAVSAREESATQSLTVSMGLPVVHDRKGGAVGPLAGVLSGLVWADSFGAKRLLTLPCDTVLVPEQALERLVRESSGYVVTRRGAESLCAVWPVACAAHLESVLSGGAHPPVQDVLRALGATEVFVEGVDVFLNINTRDDLERAESVLGNAAKTER